MNGHHSQIATDSTPLAKRGLINRHRFRTQRLSKKLKQKAAKLMPAGVADSIFVNNAKGSHIWDVDRNEYIDYKLGYGSVILGHSHPAVQNKVHEYDKRGVIYGSDIPLEITLAEKIRSIIPSAEMIRYFVSGTEATMNAIKIARAYTGKEKILKFEGQYHGLHDYLSFSTEPSANSRRGSGSNKKPQPDSIGIPKALEKLILVNEWNDFDAVEKTVKKESDNIAAIITEPIMANTAVIPPEDGYLQFLKELCDNNHIVLIFDEVKTGFRIARGGAQELFGVKPHLTAIAKSFGNGYPISAVVGPEDIMKDNATRQILHQGTYARNPVSVAAADATVDEIKKRYVHQNIEKFGTALIRGIRDILHDKKKVDAMVQGYPSMFQVLFTKQDSIHNYRESLECNKEFFTELQGRLLKRGIMLGEPSFTCASHNNEDLRQTLEAFEASLQEIPIASSSSSSIRP
jgi:glutamate-1-semialdehyde 2,1-aminomutase